MVLDVLALVNIMLRVLREQYSNFREIAHLQ